MTDHKASSEDLLERAYNANSHEAATSYAAQAQVHATLHLADVLAQKGANQ